MVVGSEGQAGWEGRCGAAQRWQSSWTHRCAHVGATRTSITQQTSRPPTADLLPIHARK